MSDVSIEGLVARIVQELRQGRDTVTEPFTTDEKVDGFTAEDYPFLQKHPDKVRTPTGKPVSSVTMEGVREGKITGEDLRISREMLINQAQVAESIGKVQMGQNLRRAAELTRVPDDQVIKMYDMLRPNRATKAQLEEMASQLEKEYDAALCAKLVREAAEVYDKRGILLK